VVYATSSNFTIVDGGIATASLEPWIVVPVTQYSTVAWSVNELVDLSTDTVTSIDTMNSVSISTPSPSNAVSTSASSSTASAENNSTSITTSTLWQTGVNDQVLMVLRIHGLVESLEG